MPYKVIFGSGDATNPAMSQDFTGPSTDAYAMRVVDIATGNMQFGVGPTGLVQYAGAFGTLAPQSVSLTANGQTIIPTATTVLITPGAARTGTIVSTPASLGFQFQQVTLVNISSTAGQTISFAAPATSNVGNAADQILTLGPGQAVTLIGNGAVWNVDNAGAMVGAGQPSPVVNAGAIANSATLTPNAAPYTLIRAQPGAAVTGIIVAVGAFDGQVVDVMNEAAAANSITFAAVATSNVADGATTAIAGVTGRRLVWNSAAAQPAWYRAF